MVFVVMLRWCVIGYGVTPEVSKYEYKIRCYFTGRTLIFQFLNVNVLNYRHTLVKLYDDGAGW